MENASKALLIAAAILVAIILIAVGMKIYSSTTGAQKVAMNTGKTISDKTGDATDIAIEEISGKTSIKYFDVNTGNEKAKKDINPGDNIEIGTEKFKVFSVENGEIKAIPYYNITLDKNNPEQSLSVGGTEFSYEAYWDYECSEINMEDKYDNGTLKNKVQEYINAYRAKLQKLVSTGIDVRILYSKDYNWNIINNKWLNPSGIGSYWVGSSHHSNNDSVITIHSDAESYATSVWYGHSGVRPIIIIH